MTSSADDTSLADRTIAAIRAEHEALTTLVATLDDAQLTGGSGASEWPLAQVLSHLGSGAEITRAGLRAALGETDPPADDFNQSVWDRWNAMSPREQADGYVESDTALVATFDALTPEQRASTQVALGFLPTPLSLASFAAMRLNELTLHSWDARVATDPDAEITADSADLLLEHFASGLSFLSGFIGKADKLNEPVVLELAGSGYTLSIDEGVSVGRDAGEPTATFSGPRGAVSRLISGRLTTEHTPADVQVSGNVTLDALREVFPGF